MASVTSLKVTNSLGLDENNVRQTRPSSFPHGFSRSTWLHICGSPHRGESSSFSSFFLPFLLFSFLLFSFIRPIIKTERERESAAAAIYRIRRHVLLHELHDYDRAHRRERRREVDPSSLAATVPVAATGPRARNGRRTDERTGEGGRACFSAARKPRNSAAFRVPHASRDAARRAASGDEYMISR